MTDQSNANEGDAPVQITELGLLKERARAMGITFSNNIGVEALKQKIAEKMDEDTQHTEQEHPDLDPTESGTTLGSDNGKPDSDEVADEEAETSPVVKQTVKAEVTSGPKVRKISLRQHLYNENMKLVRCRITCLDPKKKDLPGEIFTFANEHLGTIRKFIPFGEQTDEGYHLEMALFKQLKRRKFLQIKVVKDKQNREQVISRWVREFALEELPPLTREELAELAAAQTASGALRDDD